MREWRDESSRVAVELLYERRANVAVAALRLLAARLGRKQTGASCSAEESGNIVRDNFGCNGRRFDDHGASPLQGSVKGVTRVGLCC
jgi:hypothetical protein